MRMNFGKMFAVKTPDTIVEPPVPEGRTLPPWLKILPVIAIQLMVRHTNWIRPLNGTYSMPFNDVLMERDGK